MNWGKSIVIVYLLFVLGIGFLVFKSTREVFEVVDVDYYQREKEFSSQLDAQNRANLSRKIPLIVRKNDFYGVRIPVNLNQSFAGEIFAYCPTSKKLDTQITINPVLKSLDSFIDVDLSALKTSNYVLKTNWRIGELNYYNEVEFNR